jgi:RimJ/RimL family protein N-acetyltransferase
MEFILRKWTEEDVDSLVKHANNFNIAKWLTNQFPSPYTKQDGEKYLSVVSYDVPTKIFAIEIDGEAVGGIGIFPQTDIHEKNAEMGYWLSEKYWGNGIMPEAIKKMVKYGFETFDITRIYARPFSTNLGSQRVLEKAGFSFEARLPKSIFKNGEYLDEMIYAVRKDD